MNLRSLHDCFASLSEAQLIQVRTLVGARIMDLDTAINKGTLGLGKRPEDLDADLRYRNQLSETFNTLMSNNV